MKSHPPPSTPRHDHPVPTPDPGHSTPSPAPLELPDPPPDPGQVLSIYLGKDLRAHYDLATPRTITIVIGRDVTITSDP